MKHVPRQEVLSDRNYSTAPLKYPRPSLPGDRNLERPSHNQYMVDNKENTLYKMQQQQSQPQIQHFKAQVRPNSSHNEKSNQIQNMPRPYSSSYDKREKVENYSTQPVGYLSQMHAPSAPVFKKPLDNRTTIKKDPPMKSSLMINQQKPVGYPVQQQYSQQKSNRFFKNSPEPVQQNTYLQKADDRTLYQSVPNEVRAKPHHSHKPAPSNSFIDNPEPPYKKNETEGYDQPQRSQEYQEYKKLQDKLQYLENKIVSIKSNIDNSNQQLAKNSSRYSKDSKQKQGLAAKFFNQKKNDQSSSSNVPAPQSNKPKNKQENSLSLSSFITQVKPSSTPNIAAQTTTANVTVETTVTQKRESAATPTSSSHVFGSAIKNLLNKPESAKAALKDNKQKSFTRKTSSEQNLVKYSSMTNLNSKDQYSQDSNFLFYVSSVIKAFMSVEIFKPYEQAREHLVQTMQAIQFAKTMRQTPHHQLEERRTMLPKKEIYRNKKTLIFDLDETLIHCNESVQVPGDVYLPIRFPTGELIEASVNIRPFATTILENLSKHFEIVVFTASHSCYANVVLDYLDPHRQWVSHRLFRESCVQTEEGAYIKDLRILGNRPLSDVLLIDNAAYSFGHQIANGVPILPYYDNKQDQELIHLQNYLMQFKNVRDMRDLNSKSLRIDAYSDFNDPIDLLQTLFKDYIPSV